MSDDEFDEREIGRLIRKLTETDSIEDLELCKKDMQLHVPGSRLA